MITGLSFWSQATGFQWPRIRIFFVKRYYTLWHLQWPHFHRYMGYPTAATRVGVCTQLPTIEVPP